MADAVRFFAILGLVLTIAGTALVSPSRPDGGFYDDVYVFRHYTGAELGSVWHGASDPTGYGTRGYRPLQPLWYHVSYAVAGEHPQVIRYAAVVLSALALALLALA